MSVILSIIAIILSMFAVALSIITKRKYYVYTYISRRRNYGICLILTVVSVVLFIYGIILSVLPANKQDYSLLSTVEETTANITDFSFIQTKEKDTATEKYAYSIGNGNYEIYSNSEDIYSIKMNSSKPTKVTVQKNKYWSNVTFAEKEMYCYIFE